MDKLDRAFKAANARLKSSNTGIVIFKRGQKLSLRGMLPSKQDSSKQLQQTVSLGIYCNGAGIKTAEKQAQKLASQLALKEFSWQDWQVNTSEQRVETVGYWICKFEENYFNRKERNQATLTTFNGDYLAIFKHLPKTEKLSDRILLEAIFKTQPNTRQRKRACIAVKALAKFAGLDLDVSEYKGNYDSTKTAARNIPSDRQLASWYESITNREWRNVYGLMAAYGLSNHEVFYADLESIKKAPGHLTVNYRKGKQEVRKIWCLYPEWWERWKLYEISKLPEVNAKNNQVLGSRVTKAFKRYNLTQPYNLRALHNE